MRWIATIAIALVSGFAGAAIWTFSGLGENQTRSYLLAHPEVLPEAMQVLQRREMVAAIEPLRQEIETPFPGAVMGNPEGSITLVEFSDYACGYCRQSVADVAALIESNPDLRVVIREYPILTAQSAEAARMALAAAQQGVFEEFHLAMFNQGQVTPETIEAAANEAGLNLELARAAIDSGQFEGQLQNNVYLAQSIGFSGTPSWVIGERTFNGAVGRRAIEQAIAEARDS
jgi:protein-disulfide isomerase